ncbi:hypothetical protein [Psychroserpens luteolus]|uniref:hypothetical protein n=1 Tax=Psychroserpens luteolus TaxID=2855840 RepID=UPI001E58B44A|nr:hypothetical protein [Psychroserpens luteolus]MCD2258333.1 hypothetical protein [Psychroserpens luteolus]
MIKTKESVFICLLFLLFFPAYAMFNNAILFLFDQAFTGGEVSKIFTYNYTGNLLGCLGMAKYIELSSSFNFFQKNGALMLTFLVSVVAFLMILKKKESKNYHAKWCLIFVFSVFLFTGLEFLYYTFSYMIKADVEFSEVLSLILIFSLIVALLAAILFFKNFSKKEKLQVFILVIPASFISAYLWLGYIGPAILPI